MKNLFTTLTICFAVTSVGLADEKKTEKPQTKPKKTKQKTLPTDLKGALEAAKTNPDDRRAVMNYISIFSRKFYAIHRKDIPAAEKMLKQYEEALKQLEPTKATGKSALVFAKRYQSLFVRRLASAKVHKALIGKPAIAVKSETWVNGTPLSESGFQGKVVLIDFGAVWCGPCIRKFPKMRAWHKKWAEKGLVIVAVTRQYNYVWDEKANRQKRSKEKVSLKDESAMLQKFAEKYKLPYRFTILENTDLHKKYGVVGIPQVVVIDRKGIVRDIQVGASDNSSKALQKTLSKLLGETKSAAGSE